VSPRAPTGHWHDRGWAAAVSARIIGLRRPRPLTGLATSVLAVALATLAIFGLKNVAPVVSLGVVYLPAVLLVAICWGVWEGLFCALLSAAAFNFFHLPPTERFTIADGRNWVSLVAFIVVALVVSAVADLARAGAVEAQQRRREADLAAAMARELLLGEDTERALGSTARRIAEALALRSAAIAGPGAVPGDRELAIPMPGADGEVVATLLVPRRLDPATEFNLREQIAPTLAALVAIARRRDAAEAERVQTESLRRSDDIKTALLRAVSHDLRTPLTSIVAAGHALGSASLQAAERVELSDSVVSEARRLADLVDKLLDLSRLQAGAAPPRADWVSVEELVSTAAESRGGEPLDYRLTVDPGVPDIRADAAQLERALANLLENARRHGGDAPIHVRVRTSGDRVLVSVVDHGPGIDPAEQARIFEPFYRGSSAPGAHGVGSGLGLAIVKGFVEANGGTITVSSLPGQGTSFVIALPVADPQGAAPAETVEMSGA
jgi:two-component system sensor histidine kinase KdpD